MKREKTIKESLRIKNPCFDKDRGNENMVAAAPLTLLSPQWGESGSELQNQASKSSKSSKELIQTKYGKIQLPDL